MKAIVTACLASLIALPALARDPQPKPSNVTIHLFGPDLITQTNANGSANAGQNNIGPNNAGSSASSSSEAQPEPTLHQVLHEMFVTGDPEQNKEPHFPRLKGMSN